jgi:hypothetical protein
VTRLLVAALVLAPAVARAERPTEGGLWSFDPGDVVLTHDDVGGGVRVHYTIAGNHAVPLKDDDADGVPDYVVQVGATTREVFNKFAELGLRAPVAEAELGLGPLGGSEAFDVYLVDFGGNADGVFLVDECDGSPPRCGGAFAMENDFAGYGYTNSTEAIDTVTSHELFHAVQGAYVKELPVWLSEGTATWAERQFRTDSRDFLRLCDGYLADTSRSLFKPPAGPVPAFAYGTALWFDFISARHDPAIVDALLTAAVDDPTAVASIEAVLAAYGDSLAEAWPIFAAWNLATGERAGEAESYPYAAKLAGVVAEAGSVDGFLTDDARIFSLSTTYYRVEHEGGPLWFGLAAPAEPLEFALHPSSTWTSATPSATPSTSTGPTPRPPASSPTSPRRVLAGRLAPRDRGRIDEAPLLPRRRGPREDLRPGALDTDAGEVESSETSPASPATRTTATPRRPKPADRAATAARTRRRRGRGCCSSAGARVARYLHT